MTAARKGRCRPAFLLALPLLTVVPGPPLAQSPLPSVRAGARPQLVELGKRLFFEATFGGNGRTCATCHDPEGEFTVSPVLIQKRFAADPAHPLFRALDSDDGSGGSFDRLLEMAVFRVPLPLHPDIAVAGEPGRRSITVLRAAPSIANVALTGPFQWDGRKGTLQEQALGAVLDHFEPQRRPTRMELLALASFQGEMFSPLRLSVLAEPGGNPPPEPGFSEPLPSPAARRGRVIFETHCGRCHGGETRNIPPDPQESRFQTVLISEGNLRGLPTWELVFTLPDGSERRVHTPDPGLAARTGRIEDLSKFEIPSLRGLRHTAPYFHDHSMNSFLAVINHYTSALLLGVRPEEFADLIAYLETL